MPVEKTVAFARGTLVARVPLRIVKMVYSTYCKQRIFYLRSKGLRAPTIARMLKEVENIPVTRVGVYELLRRFSETGCLMRCPGSGRKTKITLEVKREVDEQM